MNVIKGRWSRCQNAVTIILLPESREIPPSRKLSCDEWEALLVDYLDGALPAGDGEGFHAHRASCAQCAEMFGQAGQGREWLNFLKVEPQAPATLVASILAQTSGAELRVDLVGDAVPASTVPIPLAPVLPFWKRGGMVIAGRMAQPRLMMTAAMAFFSITLLLQDMAVCGWARYRLADLKPASLSNNLDKQFHMASARVIRYCDNLRFFYVMEAQVKEFRQQRQSGEQRPGRQAGQPAPSATP